MEEQSNWARLRLGVAYDGTEFHGWAVQPQLRTVAGEVTRALGVLFSEISDFTVAGRTDAGVHATGQVVHVDVPAAQWAQLAERLLWRLRGILPPDVRVTSVEEVPASFNARFAALWRRYRYRIADNRWGVDPLRRNDTLAWKCPLDMEAMNAASRHLLGEHDFASFCKKREGATTVRALLDFTWDRDGDGVLEATVRADAFCHSMVRSLVGAVAAVGEGRRDEAWLVEVLAAARRSSEVAVAPAHGLTLVEVAYPDDPSEWDERVSATRRVRTLEAQS
ncbi:tRNA pseudouridine(38-40) synthase TruA [Natronoglycomyces albus]|uniref:tRNA pseudouridine synthase A n=1 Tax=Natronoglycomyces albus TaxID=2811108 RepID=A0A895XK41_9ACTN|nr:tRNA pseudouridine(38-40) synthase TruA [Natronoglycomyces albus]QSB06121.1 tRNA pseudouridine(38-40) synthase TruA [Natronoglycomyces albus]